MGAVTFLAYDANQSPNIWKNMQNQYNALVALTLIGILTALPIVGHAQGTGLTRAGFTVSFSAQ